MSDSDNGPLSCRCCSCSSDSDHCRQTIDQLLTELDAERAAAATAASESMDMIRRLQREKSDAMLESRQFRRFAEEQMARYRFEIEALEEVLGEKEEAILSLSNELHDCKKMFDDLPHWLNYTLDDATIMEKQVVKQSPNQISPLSLLSTSTSGSPLHFDNYEYADIPDPDPDRACTIDTTSLPNYQQLQDTKSTFAVAMEEEDIRKLCERVKVLEKDRESVRQLMDSIKLNKDKGVILKEIKQKLYEDVVPHKKTVVKRGGFFKRFSILPILKCSIRWIKSKIFARRKPLRIRYTFGQTARNVGLLVLLHMLPAPRPRKNLCLREPKGV